MIKKQNKFNMDYNIFTNLWLAGLVVSAYWFQKEVFHLDSHLIGWVTYILVFILGIIFYLINGNTRLNLENRIMFILSIPFIVFILANYSFENIHIIKPFTSFCINSFAPFLLKVITGVFAAIESKNTIPKDSTLHKLKYKSEFIYFLTKSML